MGGRDTNSLAADAASSTSERIERTERIESGGGKKSKMQQKYLSVTSDDLWRFRDKLSGKWSNLAKTYKTNKEANDKVCELNQQASKYVETLALLFANFERMCAEKKEAEDQFDRDFDESLNLLSHSQDRCARVAETHARIEEDLNEGLRVIRNHFLETASATLALTCGKNDRGHNEAIYLQESLAIVDALLAKDTHDDGFEVIVTERPEEQQQKDKGVKM